MECSPPKDLDRSSSFEKKILQPSQTRYYSCYNHTTILSSQESPRATLKDPIFSYLPINTMKFVQPIFMLLLTVLVAVSAQEDCEAICNERVQQAVQPVQDEKVRAEEWGHGVRRELDEAYNKMRAVEEDLQQHRVAVEARDQALQDRDRLVEERDRAIQERDQTINELRGNVENSKREVEGARREIEQIKHDSNVELDELRTKAEESSRSLGRVQFALDEANDHIKEMESARISVNIKGIQEDVRIYWKNLLGWWTGLVMPDKKKKEEEF